MFGKNSLMSFLTRRLILLPLISKQTAMLAVTVKIVKTRGINDLYSSLKHYLLNLTLRPNELVSNKDLLTLRCFLRYGLTQK